MTTLIPSSANSRRHGFTLVELLIAIAVLGILSSMAAPPFMTLIASQRVRSAATDLHGGLLLARSEAMKRNLSISVTANDASNWSKGWKVGSAGTDFLKQDAVDHGIVVEGPGSGNVTFQWTGRPDSASIGVLLKVRSSSYSVPARCLSLSLSGMAENKAC